MSQRAYSSLSNNFTTFSSKMSYSYRVYSTILYVRSEFDRIFFRYGSSQGDRAYINMFMSNDCWNYFTVKFSENATHTPVNRVSTMLCRKRSSFDLSQEKFKLKTVLDIVKIVTTEGLKCLCEIFGSSLGVGVRKKFPAIKQPSENCSTGDKVNVLDIREGKKDKVIFRYDYGASKLFISMRYSHFIIKDVTLSDFDELPQMEMIAFPTDQDASSSSSSSVDIMGCNLFIGNTVYVVTHVADGQVTCASVQDADVTVQLPLDDANNFIDKYNM